jgi:2-polyprenyl-3-methyl-5-hydroxy-6-metoxy-1,4-benzoquinol methylase
LDEIVGGVERYRRSGRWLDIGCGAGSLIRAAARAGWAVEGTEISPAPVTLLRAEGHAVHLGDLMTLELLTGAYDVATLIEVLEHVPQPLALLRRAFELLRPGGVLYLTTPHGRGISSRLLGMRWSVVSPPEHLQLFSVVGLCTALDAAGFATHNARTRGVNPYELVRAARRRDGEGAKAMEASERVQTSYQLNAALLSRSSGLLVKRAANAALAALRLGDSLTCHAVRAGTTRADTRSSPVGSERKIHLSPMRRPPAA